MSAHHVPGAGLAARHRQASWSSSSGAVGVQNCQHDGVTASLWECAQKAGAGGWGVGGGFQKRQNVGRDTKSTVTVTALAPLGDAVIQRLQNS